MTRRRTISLSNIASDRNLPLGAPDVLEQAVALGQAVQSIVALTHGTHETREGVDDVLALDGTAVLVDLCDSDLAGAVVLGLDDPPGGRALAGDVAGGSGVSQDCMRHGLSNARDSSSGKASYRSTISPRSFSIFAIGVEFCGRTRLGGCVAVSGSRTANFRSRLRISTTFGGFGGCLWPVGRWVGASTDHGNPLGAQSKSEFCKESADGANVSRSHSRRRAVEMWGRVSCTTSMQCFLFVVFGVRRA